MGEEKTMKNANITGSGPSGRVLTSKDPVVMAAADGHMHIQSGHVGTIPFILGVKLPFAAREKTQDISFKELNLRIDRKFLDGAGKFYENRYRPFVEDLAWKTGVLAERTNVLTGTIEEKKKKAQRHVFSVALKICKVIQKAYLAYEGAVNTDYKRVVDLMTVNFEILEGALRRGEDLARAGKEITHLERDIGEAINRAVQRKADMLTGICIGIATMVIDFHLRMIEETFDATLELLAAFRRKVEEFTDNILTVFASVTSLRKNIAKVICWDIVQIVMESAGDIHRDIEDTAEYAQAATTTLHLVLEALSHFLEKWTTRNIGELLAIQGNKTYAIAQKAVDGHAASMMEYAKEAGAEPEHVFGPIIALPMDMDYSHLDRFKKDDRKAQVYQYCNKRYWLLSGVGKKVWKPGIRKKQDIPLGAIRTLLAPETSLPALNLLKMTNVVEEEEGDFYYFNSKLSGLDEGQHFWVHDSEFEEYEHWYIQRKDTIRSVINNPWKIVPLYHFEPRRYLGNCNEAFDQIMHKGASASSSPKERLFIGFKVYPNLGYKPLDPRLPSLDKMYAFCCNHDIPVMTHGSPQGAFTHDRPIYYEYDNYKNLTATVPLPDLDTMKHIDKETHYFIQEYGSPFAWETVLKEYNDLKLCIAHFGGADDRIDSTEKEKKPLSGWNVPADLPEEKRRQQGYWNQKIIDLMRTYNNLYTDLSCHDMKKNSIIGNLATMIIRWPDLRKRILFGTDWYMTEISGMSYQNFTAQMKEAIDTIDSIVRASGNVPEKDPPLWQWLTEINPFRFYRFDRIAKEYSGELIRVLEGDDDGDDTILVEKMAQIAKTKQLIFAIAKKLKQLGGLPDAVIKE